jgi:hypothetical protein
MKLLSHRPVHTQRRTNFYKETGLASNREIISKGRCQSVTDAELEELRAANVSWFAYCQKRLTANHADALAALLKYRRG